MIDYEKLQKSMLAAALKGNKIYLLGKSVKYPSVIFITFGEYESAIGYYAIPDSVFLLDAGAYMKAIDQMDYLNMDTLIKDEDKAQPAYSTGTMRAINGCFALVLTSEDHNTTVLIRHGKATEYIKQKAEMFYACTNVDQPVFFTADFPGSEFPYDGAILPVRIK